MEREREGEGGFTTVLESREKRWTCKEWGGLKMRGGGGSKPEPPLVAVECVSQR